MKKKYLKKMLAIALAAMTVCATPGLVGAISGESQKAIGDANAKISSHTLAENEIAKHLDRLQKAAEEDPDDEAKTEVAKVIKALMDERELYNDIFRTNEKLREQILKIWKKCSSNPNAKQYVAGAIACFAKKDLLDLDSLYQVLDILEECSSDKKSKEEIARAIIYIAHEFIFYDNALFDRILKILQRCLDSEDVKKNIASAVRNLLCVNFNNIFHRIKLKKEQLELILNMLRQCLSSPDAKQFIARAIGRLAACRLIEKDSLNQILNMLQQCPGDNDGSIFVSLAMCDIASQGFLETASIDKTLNILSACLKKNSTVIRFISKTIKDIETKGLLDQCMPNQIQQVAELLIKSLKNNFAAENAVTTVKSMTERGLLNHCRPDQIQKIVASVIGYLGNNKTQANAIAIIKKMNENQLLNLYEPDNIQQTVGDLIGHLANNNTREAATIIISTIEKKGLLNQCTPNQLHQILNLFKTHLADYLAPNGNYEMADRIFEVLKKCSEIDDLKADVTDIADMLKFEDSFFLYLNMNPTARRLGNFFDILISCSSLQNTETQKKAVFVMSAMLHNLSISITQTTKTNATIQSKIPQIIEMLNILSVIEEAKLHVSDTIGLLGARGFFHNLNDDQRRILSNTLDNCLIYNNQRIADALDIDIDIDENQENIVISVCNIFNSGIMAKLLPDAKDKQALDTLELKAWAAMDKVYRQM